MFATVPVLNATNNSEDRIENIGNLDEVAPHANVTVNGVSTPCVEALFSSGRSIIILLDMTTMKQRLGALTGKIDDYGTLA